MAAGLPVTLISTAPQKQRPLYAVSCIASVLLVARGKRDSEKPIWCARLVSRMTQRPPCITLRAGRAAPSPEANWLPVPLTPPAHRTQRAPPAAPLHHSARPRAAAVQATS